MKKKLYYIQSHDKVLKNKISLLSFQIQSIIQGVILQSKNAVYGSMCMYETKSLNIQEVLNILGSLINYLWC